MGTGARTLVAAVGVRIESGPGGADTDEWVVSVELGPGISVRDVDGLAVALVATLAERVDWIAEALRRQSAEPAA